MSYLLNEIVLFYPIKKIIFFKKILFLFKLISITIKIRTVSQLSFFISFKVTVFEPRIVAIFSIFPFSSKNTHVTQTDTRFRSRPPLYNFSCLKIVDRLHRTRYPPPRFLNLSGCKKVLSVCEYIWLPSDGHTSVRAIRCASSARISLEIWPINEPSSPFFSTVDRSSLSFPALLVTHFDSR